MSCGVTKTLKTDRKHTRDNGIDISDNTREDIKDLLRIIKDLTVTKENFRYRDWVTKLNTRYSPYCKLDKKLEDINGASAWDIISYEFSIMIKYDHEKIKDEEIDIDHFSPDSREYIKTLKKNLR
ncbi:hypothetical protein GLOIN_2v1777104 [Rhizophagus irregularis DAOM 181602=DAOM 197198]|uniref:Uncharacterized protein n=1 Tax=Rhizophagus irregularis (strain DAOM 181602 / DAOM 197198 / MUCL 43194) TaxID=747089 RepID=U9T7K2_RHIID|nr:hypothetical protein GLOIN_2v1777104 [Rhizophagus irregularis DAOM 181602=DAOM 197198]CAG8593670.1 1722_t:CDS:2 [Rhizophagus irregularis]